MLAMLLIQLRLRGNVLVEHTQPVMPLTCNDITWHLRAGRAGVKVLKDAKER